ncbi:LDCC motif putative metal-binding protein [Irregularibacter muris]|uniref:LDCC motif putative metal-binding protein n=1 Tax=Irregularibacter muris TaxID=1796619 RepID=A0AAE3HGE7_9FIRM|nr:LDCC motif putative metal-binding protein [Irregularibacter muris]MCR1898564.1 LDCC motif putative metal-binding protein [Irregularibacter muris]
MKKWFSHFLKKLEQANKENFGSERMDCCAVNQKSNHDRNTNKGKQTKDRNFQ